jgi:hypothetical protein
VKECPVELIDTVDGTRRIAFVGLAKNTGKTTALAALIPKLHARGERLGVTSVGRDGEAVDVTNHAIRKPALCLPAGSLVATTQTLLHAGGVAHQVLACTDHRTPLGRVVIAELTEAGALEVAGPSSASGIRAVGELMLTHGCDRLLVDGSIDRRGTAAPSVVDGVVMATGAVLSTELETVVRHTRSAVDLVQLPVVADARLRELARTNDANLLVTASREAVTVPPDLLLTGSEPAVAALLQAYPVARYLLLRGALCEPFVEHLLQAHRTGSITLVTADATKIFLSRRGSRWYAEHGIHLEVLANPRLCAVTVNPVAPRSHHLPTLLRRIRAEIPEVPVFDVLGGARTGEKSH